MHKDFNCTILKFQIQVFSFFISLELREFLRKPKILGLFCFLTAFILKCYVTRIQRKTQDKI